ncbi:MAG: ribonuclease Z [Actinobacteria bacterium]|nr:ribonuclease Z [Actinomycetota bacterium]
MEFDVTFLGTGASVPSAGRGTAATLVRHGSVSILVDCGEGTQRQFLRSGVGLSDVDAIFVTHLHGDHVYGLPGLLKTLALRDRDRALPIVGPRGLSAFFTQLEPIIGRLPFPLDVQEWTAADAADFAAFRVEPFATKHRIASWGYRFVEHDRPGAFDVDTARGLGVPEGPAFGLLQRGTPFEHDDGRVTPPGAVLGPPRPGRRIALTGDTVPHGETVDAARGADLLVHEGTFLDADADRARETSHSTVRGAALIALAADVGLLAVTHIAGRVFARDARAEAEQTFERSIVPRDFDRVEIPFPERGAPRHVRWSADEADTIRLQFTNPFNTGPVRPERSSE